MKCFATIVSHSHLRAAEALSRSLLRTENTEPLHVLITDVPAERQPPDTAMVRYATLQMLEDAGPPGMPVYFGAFELCNALKPFFVDHLLNQGAKKVVLLDSDIMSVGSFAPVWEQLETARLILTPHLTTPPPLDLPYSNEIEIVDQGVYNGGFLACREGVESREALSWMKSRFPLYGFMDRRNGMFVDQKLIPLLPVYFPSTVTIWRDLRVNIAFWNAHERTVTRSGNRYTIGGQNVIFFHLSGYRIETPDVVCSYLSSSANAGILRTAPWLALVLRDYRDLMGSVAPIHSGEYGHARCQGGILLTPDLRRLYFKCGKLSARDPAFWRVRTTDFLRKIKRLVFPYRAS